ncbi:MAG TPA: SMI1/KNR4 family protein [Chitinophagaceae bacterium]|nr:SMI1/KNR4 family protein [Chitinophagaceae bacterium]
MTADQKLNLIEKERNISLPEIYREFYSACSIAIPEELVGSDLLNKCPDLHTWAIDLLEGDGLMDLLEKDDLVFMMHQGYFFFYFKADGNADPIVYGYHDRELKRRGLGHLSQFLKKYIK